MKLSEKEKKIICEIVTKYDAEAILYLHGECDLLVISNKIDFKNKIAILVFLKEKMGHQKLDLTISHHYNLSTPYIQSIIEKAVELKCSVSSDSIK